MPNTYPADSIERAYEEAVIALVPVTHAIKYNLDWPNAVANAEEKLQDFINMGGSLTWFDEEHPHLADAAHYVWG